MQKHKSSQNEYVLSVAIKFASVLLALVYSAISSRYLGPEIKGHVAYITSLSTIGSIILTVGMHQAYPYYKKNMGTGKFLHAYMNSILFVHILYVLLSIFACLAVHELSFNLMVSILLMPLMSYARIVGYAYLVESPNRRNIIYFWVEILDLVIIASLFFTTESTTLIAVVLLLVKDLLLSVIYSIKLRFQLSFRHIDICLAGRLMRFGFTPMVALLMSTMNYRVDILMLQEYKNVSMADIGVYSIGVTVAEKMLLVPEAVKEVLLSKLVREKDAGEVAKVIRVCLPIVVLCCLAFLLAGRTAISLFFGKEYIGAYSITMISIAGTIGIMFYKMIATYNIVNKHQATNLILLTTSIGANVVCNIFLIPRYGTVGAAIGSLISYTLCGLVFCLSFSKGTGIRIRDLLFIKRSDIEGLRKSLRSLTRHRKGWAKKNDSDE